eukprot:Selendium_serpulae@DN2600_c0_g1_i1.p1
MLSCTKVFSRCFLPSQGAARLTQAHKRFISVAAMKMNVPLKEIDPELSSIIDKETERWKKSICLIGSENFAPKCVGEALASVMVNKYSEGYPGMRYYGGNEFIDAAEILCQKRALEAFKLDSNKWAVNVQSLSGSPANFAVYTGLLEPHDRILSLDLPHGGHLSHGFHTPAKKVSAVSKYFDVLPYRLNEKTGLIDYEKLEFLAERYRPKIIIAGASAYSRLMDYAKFREIADSVNAVLMADMAHIAGPIAAGLIPSPFEHCHVVTTTTHKTLRGPRGAMIFSRIGDKPASKSGKTEKYDFAEKIDSAVFPGLQGGPHNHTISALATALKQATTEEFKEYQAQTLANSTALAKELLALGFDLVSGGTDNHLCLVDLRGKGLSGAKTERICELSNITLNKNTIPTDKSALNPSGVRIGTPAMTSRGLVEKDFKDVAKFIDRAVTIGLNVQKETGQKLAPYQKILLDKPPQELSALRKEVEQFAGAFELPGWA